MATAITNLADQTFFVGDKVRHNEGWTGTITSIDDREHIRAALLIVEPDDVSDVPEYMCWQLNKEARRRTGLSTFCKPRDHGLSMGNYSVIARAS